MGWIRKLTGKADPEPAPSASGGDVESLIRDLQVLLDQGGLAAFERQLRLAELVADRDWQLDQAAGELRLGSDLVYPAQLLGSASAASVTWLWAWANPSVDAALTQRVEEARAIGEARGIPLLTDEGFPLGDLAVGHLVALAVSALLDADAYYRCPYAGGEAFVLLEAPATREAQDGPLTRSIFTITRAVESMPPLLTRPGIASYLRGAGLPVTESEREILVAGGEAATFRFDRQGRLTEIDGTLS